MRSRATEDSVARLRVNVRNLEPDMNAQLYTLHDLTRLPTGNWTNFCGPRASLIDYSVTQKSRLSLTLLLMAHLEVNLHS